MKIICWPERLRFTDSDTGNFSEVPLRIVANCAGRPRLVGDAAGMESRLLLI